MRDIKYRLWCKDLEEIIDVNKMGFENNELWYIECIDHDDKELLYFPEKNDHVLMQYTGLTDKNGVEIYEGDLLKFEHLENYAHDIQVVSMSGCCWGTDEYAFFEMTERKYIFEVVGNIYENPELLGESK